MYHRAILSTGCALIAITIIGRLTYSINKVFKIAEITDEVRKSTFAVFVSYIIWNVLTAIAKTLDGPQFCAVSIIFQNPPFVATRASLYYFFIVRTEQTFSGTALAFKASFIKILKIFIISIYIVFGLFYVLSGFFRVHDGEKCWFAPHSIWLRLYIFMAPLYTLIDFVLGLYIACIYLHRLWKVHMYLNTMKMVETQQGQDVEKSASSAGSTNVTTEFASNELLLLIKKQGKLAFISYLSTIFFIYNTFLSWYITVFTLYLDGVINALCVYCTFAVKQKYYDVLCNCNGNKGLLCAFCFCCHCCNTAKVVPFEGRGRGSKSASDGKSKSGSDGKSKSDGTSDNKTKDVTATTATTVDIVLH